jgi:hypothetical protein
MRVRPLPKVAVRAARAVPVVPAAAAQRVPLAVTAAPAAQRAPRAAVLEAPQGQREARRPEPRVLLLRGKAAAVAARPRADACRRAAKSAEGVGSLRGFIG